MALLGQIHRTLTVLYSWSISAMIELDARKFGAKPVQAEGESPWSLTRKYSFQFVSLIYIVLFMLWGYTVIL
jgi:hypothetical protein